MPVLSTPNIQSPPTNCFGLVQYLQGRLPGYDPSEYLRELNSAYVHVWEEVTKLKNHYFTNIKTVTTTLGQFQYDLMFNADGGLSSPVSNRLYQITKIRIQPPSGGLFQPVDLLSPTDPEFTTLAANPAASPSQTGPYKAHLYGRNNINFAIPIAVGTKFEVTYTFWLNALVYRFDGTISNAGTTVTGVGTSFTRLLQPDFQANIPTTQQQEEIQAEIIVAQPSFTQTTNQIYRVSAIASDTSLTTATAIAPVQPASSSYVLATLPEIPREHIRVIASIALKNMYSVAGDDARVTEWTATAQSNLQMMKDSLVERQSNNPARRQRFPYGIGRRNRAFLR